MVGRYVPPLMFRTILRTDGFNDGIEPYSQEVLFSYLLQYIITESHSQRFFVTLVFLIEYYIPSFFNIKSESISL